MGSASPGTSEPMTDPSEFEFAVPPHLAEMHAMAQQRFKRRDWEEPPSNWLPGLVPVEHVAGRSDDAIVLLSPIRAYRTGFSIDLVSQVREPDPMLAHTMFGGMHGGMPSADGGLPDSLLRVALAFSDGTTTSTLEMMGPPPPPGSESAHGPEGAPSARTMMMSGGNSSGDTFSFHYWCWPLPPEGAIRVICEWPQFGIERQVTELDAGPILEAASRAEQLWDDLPEPPDDWMTGGGAHVHIG